MMITDTIDSQKLGEWENAAIENQSVVNAITDILF
jgi:hypothetical protein